MMNDGADALRIAFDFDLEGGVSPDGIAVHAGEGGDAAGGGGGEIGAFEAQLGKGEGVAVEVVVEFAGEVEVFAEGDAVARGEHGLFDGEGSLVLVEEGGAVEFDAGVEEGEEPSMSVWRMNLVAVPGWTLVALR